MTTKKRALFEDAGAETAKTLATPGAAEQAKMRARRRIAIWQFVLAALVALTVIIGGLTRLTDSGLSITEWNVVSGIIPPLSEAGWQDEFAKYQQIPEFTEQNFNMTLAEFKPIYWWEWGHRILGRLVGLAWLIPFVAFLALSQIPRGWTLRLAVPGVLIIIQGAIGWWMVASGLPEEAQRTDVAPYRLAVHLGGAFLIFALVVWNGLKLLKPEHALVSARRGRKGGVLTLARVCAGLLFVQILSGALVAGLDAGRGYPDWPLMNGYILPPEAWELAPTWVNFFENAALAQFDHRIIAYILLAVLAWYAIRAHRSGHRGIRFWGLVLLLGGVAQAVWGIVTLVNLAALEYASLHQLGGILLWLLALRAMFEAAYPGAQSLRDGR